MLTHLQHRTLSAIHQQVEDTGTPPTVRELAGLLGCKGLGHVQNLLIALEERGFIRRRPNKARAIEVIKLPPSIGRTS